MPGYSVARSDKTSTSPDLPPSVPPIILYSWRQPCAPDQNRRGDEEATEVTLCAKLDDRIGEQAETLNEYGTTQFPEGKDDEL